MNTEQQERSLQMQERLLKTTPPLPVGVDELFTRIMTHLRTACDDRLLKTKPHEVIKLLKKTSEGQPKGYVAILGGQKNQRRTKELPHFERDDNSWFDFAITLNQHSNHLELVGYNFEIRFPDGVGPSFVRFDLNKPGDTKNDEKGLRSHLHPSSDDLQLPSPVLSPLEILDVLVYGLRRTAGRKPRGV